MFVVMYFFHHTYSSHLRCHCWTTNVMRVWKMGGTCYLTPHPATLTPIPHLPRHLEPGGCLHLPPLPLSLTTIMAPLMGLGPEEVVVGGWTVVMAGPITAVRGMGQDRAMEHRDRDAQSPWSSITNVLQTRIRKYPWSPQPGIGWVPCIVFLCVALVSYQVWHIQHRCLMVADVMYKFWWHYSIVFSMHQHLLMVGETTTCVMVDFLLCLLWGSVSQTQK